MIQSKLSWNGQQSKQLLLTAAWEALVRATVFLWTEITTVTLAKPNTGTRHKAGGHSFTVYDHPSKPGEAPHAITSWLRKHVGYELDQQAGATRVGIGANALYGLFLELGVKGGKEIVARGKALAFWSSRESRIIFRKKVRQGAIKARPWLLATVKRVWGRLAEIAGGK